MSLPGGVESGWPVAAPQHGALEPADPGTVGPFRVEGVLGDGGLGRVYLGRTPAGSVVAVKVVHREFAADKGFRTRLEQELAPVRRVQGLYTVPVVDADPWAERPWLATAYVAGPSLQHAVTEHGPGSADAVLRLVAAVAEALQSLHAADVLHRDLKPANVLLTAGGPRLTDFGISRAADGTSVTRTGALTGTPAYLAPEYIRGDEVTEAADVFGLGLSAYFAVTGRLAFGGGHEHAVTYRIMEQEPDLEGCPEPLRGIVAACLHKDPRQRPTPTEVIERCGAATDGAGPPPPPATVPPNKPTEPVATQITEAAITQPVVAAPPGIPPQPHQQAPAQRGPSRRRLLLAATGLVGVAGLGVAGALLWPEEDTPDSAGEPQVAGPFRLAATITTRHDYEVNGVAFSPDGRVLATAGGDIRLWDVAGRKQQAVLTGDGLSSMPAFSPDGQLLATADVTVNDDRTVSLWDVAGRETLVRLTGHTGDITELAFSPDGRLLASADEDTVRLWEVPSGRPRAVLRDYGAGSVDFHPGGRLLASGSGSNVSLWDLPGGRHRDFLDGHENVWDVAFSPDGRTLVVSDAGAGQAGGRMVVWDTAVIGQQNAVLGGHEVPIRQLAFSPDGRLLANSGEKMRVWDLASGKPSATFGTGGDVFSDVAFSSTGMLATTSSIRVKLWERA